jgi:hypothetical protein
MPRTNPWSRGRGFAAAFLVGASATVGACGGAGAPAAPAAPAKPSAVARIQEDAKALAPLVTAPFTRRFLDATAGLPHVAPRTLYRDADKSHFYTAREAAALPEATRRALVAQPADEGVYYETKYGSPLSYARPFDVLAENGVTLKAGTRILDFGFGYIGHLRLLGSLGLDAFGVDADPMLRALYAEPGDQGIVAGAPPGKVRIAIGKFPADAALRATVGTGYDVIVSKNTLKRGYIHPDRPADPKFLIDLGASDAEVLAAFHDALVPGGTMLVYNICPAPTPLDKPFIPWSDGRSPFTAEQWRAAGFEVKIFDRDDTATLRAFARAMGWGSDPDEPWDLEHDLSVLYTLVRRLP